AGLRPADGQRGGRGAQPHVQGRGGAGQLAGQGQQLGPLPQAAGLLGGGQGALVGQRRFTRGGQVPGRFPGRYQVGQASVQGPALIRGEQPRGDPGDQRGGIGAVQRRYGQPGGRDPPQRLRVDEVRGP